MRITCRRFTGPVRLRGARPSGALFANGARLGRPGEEPEEPWVPATTIAAGVTRSLSRQ
ncbi:hypothetical protein [Streptomyces olivaceoviridis]|uniref:hypothetical protein n=1 Tax=Streptomyces olivaceoviridis TaxID=1921 RepID=UPI00370049FD